ncbi:DUF2911 domain-containing protein [Spongiimicrobium salis]|uniref:DUF2911 domain-containing protein n=1 Tax=Spongiimicrobium salis TaxID=1667022 RepID=UPI00374CEB1A
MKKLTLLACLLFVAVGVQAQITTPQPSPSSTLKQTVGLTDITVEYSRPSMRGRTIFGGLEAYGEVWRTGANANTTVAFSDDVKVDGQTLKAGTYALYTRPGKTTWEVYFYADTNNWGTPRKWDDSKVVAKTTVEVYPMPMPIETFTISFDDLTNNAGVLGLLWEKTYVGVKIEVPTVEKAVASIENVMNGPSGGDYYAAASYYYEEGKDLKKAKEWIDKAVAMDKEGRQFWVMRRQALIYAKLGDKKGAIAAAKKSLAAAEAANNGGYVRQNKASLKEWGAL